MFMVHYESNVGGNTRIDNCYAYLPSATSTPKVTVPSAEEAVFGADFPVADVDALPRRGFFAFFSGTVVAGLARLGGGATGGATGG